MDLTTHENFLSMKIFQTTAYIYIYIYIYICVYVCISYIPGVRDLPDMHARLPEGTAPKGECAYIGQSMIAWDITNMLHFLHSAL